MICLIFVLSINRLSIVARKNRRYVVLLCKVLTITSLAIGLVVFLIFAIDPEVTAQYDSLTYCWRYMHTPRAYIMALSESCA
ncbi:unnamed protein product, partial [Anisakis simplex]